jgi:hypothetical protein
MNLATLTNYVFAAGIFFFLLLILKLIIFGRKKSISKYPYKRQDALFSPAEKNFLGVLKLAVADKALVFGKVRIADVITTTKIKDRSQWQTAFNKISGKHFDFILCDKDNLDVLCAIELNDSSHNSKKAQVRDNFVIGVCNAADLPLIMYKARGRYTVNDVKSTISELLPPNLLD